MIASLAARLSALEGDARILAVFKLANVGLAMLWGFAITFVFVRVLPLDEFRVFLLLVAFANFTVSADFGFSGILYARLRRHKLIGAEAGFQPREVAMLFAFMALVMAVGAAVIVAGLAGGHIRTAHPGLFLAFYLLTATNIFVALTKRALAALDHNLFWELTDTARRCLSLGLLFVALAGVPVLAMVLGQIALAIAGLGAGVAVVHVAAGMTVGDWLPFGAMPWRGQGRDMSATLMLTLSDVAAYNAPYAGIAIATHDPRPLLLFDFLFKMSRALTAVIRAFVEATLPRLTAAWHEGKGDYVARYVRRLLVQGLGCAILLGAILLVFGGQLSGVLFDGHAILARGELAIMALLLIALAVLCVSTFVHNAFGRFSALLPPSFLFLGGSVLSVPLSWWFARYCGIAFGTAFLLAYALVHILAAVWHVRKLQGLARL